MRLNMSSAKWRPLYRASMSQNVSIHFNIHYINSTCTLGAMYRFMIGDFYDSLNDSLQTTLYCHIDTWFVTCSLWICHYALLYIYGINDVWILKNLESYTGKMASLYWDGPLYLWDGPSSQIWMPSMAHLHGITPYCQMRLIISRDNTTWQRSPNSLWTGEIVSKMIWKILIFL